MVSRGRGRGAWAGSRRPSEDFQGAGRSRSQRRVERQEGSSHVASLRGGQIWTRAGCCWKPATTSPGDLPGDLRLLPCAATPTPCLSNGAATRLRAPRGRCTRSPSLSGWECPSPHLIPVTPQVSAHWNACLCPKSRQPRGQTSLAPSGERDGPPKSRGVEP